MAFEKKGQAPPGGGLWVTPSKPQGVGAICRRQVGGAEEEENERSLT